MPPTSILALHGFTGRGSDWDLLRAALPGRTWNAPDLPGHGPAPELPADWPAHRRAIEKACTALPEKPVLTGYSMGGRLALRAALALPGKFSALVLIGASPGLETEAERAARRESDAALDVRILKSYTRLWRHGTHNRSSPDAPRCRSRGARARSGRDGRTFRRVSPRRSPGSVPARCRRCGNDSLKSPSRRC